MLVDPPQHHDVRRNTWRRRGRRVLEERLSFSPCVDCVMPQECVAKKSQRRDICRPAGGAYPAPHSASSAIPTGFLNPQGRHDRYHRWSRKNWSDGPLLPVAASVRRGSHYETHAHFEPRCRGPRDGKRLFADRSVVPAQRRRPLCVPAGRPARRNGGG